MSERWERTYAIGVPVERVWEVFTSREELAVLMTPPAGAETQHAPSTLRVLEAEPV